MMLNAKLVKNVSLIKMYVDNVYKILNVIYLNNNKVYLKD